MIFRMDPHKQPVGLSRFEPVHTLDIFIIITFYPDCVFISNCYVRIRKFFKIFGKFKTVIPATFVKLFVAYLRLQRSLQDHKRLDLLHFLYRLISYIRSGQQHYSTHHRLLKTPKPEITVLLTEAN